jgi:lipoteichoic acid synthase
VNKTFSKLWFFWFASILLWLKTHFVQRLYFDLPVKSLFQEMILLISPISSIIFLLWLCLFLSSKRQNGSIVFISIITSFILFANVVYYRFFNDFITLPVLFQISNMGDLGDSALGLMRLSDLFIFADVLLLLTVILVKKPPQMPIRRQSLKYMLAASIAVFLVNWGLAEIVRPQLLTRTFDRQILVKSIGAYNYHIYDIVLNSKTKTQKAFASSSELTDVENYVKEEKPAPPPEEKSDLFGIAKGKNVILISMESTQSFVINNTLFGQEITPFLNDFIKDSFYFEQFYHQTGQGKTSDAEFIIDNSLYPLPRGAVYFTHSQNEYNSTPKILDQYGYYSASFHANDRSFWNRDIMYQNLGYDHFFAKEDYNVTEENSVGWGLKDKPFFEQSVPLMKTLPQPFYAKLLTLTNHHPFRLGEEDQSLPLYNSGDGTVDRYFGTVRYTDQALELFVNRLKEEGLYNNSIIVIYGDHYGISANHNRAMSQFMGKEINPYEHVQLQRVPFIIHIPGVEGKVISRAAGQIDVRPTLLHLLGIEGHNEIDFGHNLFADNQDPLVVLRDGSFITNTHLYTENTCYQARTGLTAQKDACEPYLEKAENQLAYSDKIIYGDLMRFNESIRERSEDPLAGKYHYYFETYKREQDPDDAGQGGEGRVYPPMKEGMPKDMPEILQEKILRLFYEEQKTQSNE